MDGFNKFINEEIYNKAIKTASRAYNVDKTTINNLIEMYQGDPVDASILLMIYIRRQERRDEISRSFSTSLIGDLKEIYNKFRSNPNELEQAIRKYLVLIKWIYESGIRNVDDIDGFVNKAISER